MIVLYLLAIVLANVTDSIFGPWMSIVNAFLFIGFNIVARDRLHERWSGKYLPHKIFALIISGSVISWALYPSAAIIGTASAVSFLVSELADTGTYAILKNRSYLVKVNGSNVVSSALDSLIFPTLAFGGLMWTIVLAQFACKVFGGFIYSHILRRFK